MSLSSMSGRQFERPGADIRKTGFLKKMKVGVSWFLTRSIFYKRLVQKKSLNIYDSNLYRARTDL